MIDTITLTIQPKQFLITDHDKFNPSTIGLFQPPYLRLGPDNHIKCVQYPTQEERCTGVYKPSLTVTKRPRAGAMVTVLKIQFSAPKLIFGNNFDELEDEDFERIISRLHEILPTMGVVVSPSVLRSAPVSVIHYSKNIVLTDYSTPAMILNELAKIDLNPRLDLNHTDFRNGGHGVKYHGNSFEIACYDKFKDLQKAKTSEKRSLEKDNATQFALLKTTRSGSPFEILRIEIRLNRRTKIKQVLEQLKISSDLSFRSLFKKSISQKILLLYFNQIKQEYRLLSYKPKSPQEFIMQFRMSNPKVKHRQMLLAFAVRTLIDAIGVRSFREAMNIYGPKVWSGLKRDLKTYQFPEGSFDPFKLVEESLIKFESVRMDAFVNNKK